MQAGFVKTCANIFLACRAAGDESLWLHCSSVPVLHQHYLPFSSGIWRNQHHLFPSQDAESLQFQQHRCVHNLVIIPRLITSGRVVHFSSQWAMACLWHCGYPEIHNTAALSILPSHLPNASPSDPAPLSCLSLETDPGLEQLSCRSHYSPLLTCQGLASLHGRACRSLF